MKKSVIYEIAIVSVIDNSSLEANDMIAALAVLFEERSSALWSEKREAEDAAS